MSEKLKLKKKEHEFMNVLLFGLSIFCFKKTAALECHKCTLISELEIVQIFFVKTFSYYYYYYY